MAVSKVVYGNTTLIDLTNDTVASEKMLQGVTAHGADGSAITGSIADKGTITKILDTTDSGWRYDLDSGYYTGGAIYVINEQRSCVPANSTIEVTPENGHVLSKVTVAPMPAGNINIGDKNLSFAPTISVDLTGLVTAVQDVSMQTTVSSFTSGYISAVESFRVNCSGSSSLQLTAQAAATYTPGTANQTIASGQYLTGVQTIKGDTNLTAANIASGVTIFGITGTHQGGIDVDDIIVIGDYGLCLNNFTVSGNICTSAAGTVSGNTLIAV